ncbi:hypothetical protein BDV95DRAFT_574440 [Massariosphaeria phaeospora]|uniref:Cyclin-dependent kinase n=1 Tax=Massariosphaeria phaeospora TaxID=100035 RepID=A0A7C8M8M9_9PLEO|nr:hypothetical protein BDV95DRAFT_574440 [Massariosphaeria phaeospora]
MPHRGDAVLATAPPLSTMNQARSPRHALTASSSADNIGTAHPPHIASFYKRELPASQESALSAASSTLAAPTLLSSSSNVSTSTAATTEFASPPPKHVHASRMQPAANVSQLPTTPAHGRNVQPSAHPIDTANTMRTGDTAASPMSLDSPVSQGFKRTADGAVKGAALATESTGVPTMGHKRNKSMDSNAASRIGELSAQLKTRLSYAMVKVQNGWERQSLEELEDQTSQHGSPISGIVRNDASRLTFESPRSVERRRRPSGVSDHSDQIMLSPAQSTPSDPSGVTPSLYWRSGTKPAMNASVNLISVTGTDRSQMLGPAAEFTPRRKRRSSASYAPPPLLPTTQRKHYSDLSGMVSSPRTPATPRPGILRMPSQQAEKDAVDTLLFMSSPNNSTRFPHTSMDKRPHPSPLRPEPRRVMFETHPVKEGPVTSQYQMQPPNGHWAAHHRQEPTR